MTKPLQPSLSVNLFGELPANPKRIRQAREFLGLTQSELADKIGVSQALVAQYEGSFKPANREVIQRIAAQTRKFQNSFFYTEPLVELPSGAVLFRAAASMTRTEEAEARRYTEIACEMACILLHHIKPLAFSLNVDNRRIGPAEAAQRARSIWGIGKSEPIPHLIRFIERSGVLVLAAPMELPKREALSVRSEQIGMPVVALFGSTTAGDRIRLSAAHELGHIILRHSKMLKLAEEKEAYQFAAELLMPEVAMRREMTQPVTLSSLAELKARWRVSIQSLIYRGRELAILDDSRARYLYTQISVKGWRKNEPIDIPIERPRLMRQLFERVYGTDFGKFANDMGLRPEFVREIMGCYEGKPTEEKIVSNVVTLRRR